MAGTTRVEAGRRRAKVAKQAVALTATACFAVVVALARQGHPAIGASSTRSVSHTEQSSSSLEREDDDFQLGGGSLAPSSAGSPPAASHTS